MRVRKIRGHKRRWQAIDRWVDAYKQIDFNHLKAYQYYPAEIIVHPWCDISVTNSVIPELRGTTKKRVLQGLIDIYDSWKIALEKINEPYYLKIWLYEPRFSKSQVVCAIEDRIAYYEQMFIKPEGQSGSDIGRYGELEERLSMFNWEVRDDEDFYDKSDLGSPEDYESIADYYADRRWFRKLFAKPHRVVPYSREISGVSEGYAFRKGHVFVVQKSEL